MNSIIPNHRLKKILPALIFVITTSLGCSTTSGEEANASATQKFISAEKEDTCTNIDLNTGNRVRLNINKSNDIATNAETGEIVRIYVDPVTRDTFDGLNGRKINHAVIRTLIGTYGIDMRKVKIEEVTRPEKGEVLAGNVIKK